MIPKTQKGHDQEWGILTEEAMNIIRDPKRRFTEEGRAAMQLYDICIKRELNNNLVRIYSELQKKLH